MNNKYPKQEKNLINLLHQRNNLLLALHQHHQKIMVAIILIRKLKMTLNPLKVHLQKKRETHLVHLVKEMRKDLTHQMKMRENR
jgi:hypothetical protein